LATDAVGLSDKPTFGCTTYSYAVNLSCYLTHLPSEYGDDQILLMHTPHPLRRPPTKRKTCASR